MTITVHPSITIIDSLGDIELTIKNHDDYPDKWVSIDITTYCTCGIALPNELALKLGEELVKFATAQIESNK